MIVIIFGFIDIFAALMMLTTRFNPAFGILALVAGFILLLKSLVFINDFASWVDLLALFFLVLTVIGINSVFAYIFIIWLLQKGVRSFI